MYDNEVYVFNKYHTCVIIREGKDYACALCGGEGGVGNKESPG